MALRTVIPWIVVLLPACAAAQADTISVPEIDPHVSSVASGGYWSSADASGHLRVTILSGGFEHVTSRAFLEWIAEEEGGPEIVARSPIAEINTPGVWSVGTPVICASDTVCLTGTNAYTLEEMGWRLRSDGPGNYVIEVREP